MSLKVGKLLFAVLALLLAACSPSRREIRPGPDFTQAEAAMAEESRREENALRGFMDVDDRPIHMKLNDQIQRVVVKKTVVKPVYVPTGEPQFLTDDEIRHMLANLPSERDIEDGVDYDEFGLGVIVGNYKGILAASASCCPFGIAGNMGQLGLSRERIVGVMDDDARKDRVQDMCMIVSESGISDSFRSSRLAGAVRNARHACICNNSAYLRESLSNFYAIYRVDKDFYKKSLVFKFRDASGNIVRHDMLDAVVNITDTLRMCP